MSRWGPAYGMDKQTHDEIVARTGRPVTQDPLRIHADDDTNTSRPSLLDKYIRPNRREAPTP